MSFRRGRGLKPSTPARIAHRLGGYLHPEIGAALKVGIRGSADLGQFLCPRMDQGNTETCHAHSAAAAIYAAMGAAGKSLSYVPSPLLIASTTYADVRAAATPAGQPLPVLQDAGAELQDDADAMKRWGIAPLGAKFGGRFSDVPDDNGYDFPEPDVSQVVTAGQHLVGGEYSIAVDASAPEVCAASLDAGIPVWLGTLVGSAFQALGPNALAEPTPSSDRTAGGHAMYLSAYRTAAGGGLEFRVENSWGLSWADDGAVWAPVEWLTACWSLWPMAVAS